MHLKEGEIRAYQDQELDDAARREVVAHLEICQRCQRSADRTPGCQATGPNQAGDSG